jgi:hypothetical protein
MLIKYFSTQKEFMKQKSLHFKIFLGFSLLAGLLLFATSTRAQAIPEFVFINPVLESGTDLQDGAKYRFGNAAAGIDAIVEIKKRSAANVVLNNIDLTNMGYEKAFQPELGIAGTVAPYQDWWVEFEISFVMAGTNSSKTIDEFDVSSLDVDGDNVSIQEYLIMEKPTSVTYSTISSLIANTSVDEYGYSCQSVQGPIQNYLNIDTLGTAVMSVYHYENTDKISLKIGAKSNGASSAAGMRLNSLWFRSFNLAPLSLLPVKLTNFSAKYDNQIVSLTWTTEQEKSFSHFIVERSDNGTDFKETAVIFAQDNASLVKNYSFADALKTAGKSFVYYRLKMVEVDQRTQISAIRVIKTGDEVAEVKVQVQAYPNPVVNDLRITVPSTWQNKPVTYDLYSMNGKLVKHIASSSASQTEVFSMMNLNAGMYIVKVSSGNETAVKQVMKSNTATNMQ